MRQGFKLDKDILRIVARTGHLGNQVQKVTIKIKDNENIYDASDWMNQINLGAKTGVKDHCFTFLIRKAVDADDRRKDQAPPLSLDVMIKRHRSRRTSRKLNIFSEFGFGQSDTRKRKEGPSDDEPAARAKRRGDLFLEQDPEDDSVGVDVDVDEDEDNEGELPEDAAEDIARLVLDRK